MKKVLRLFIGGLLLSAVFVNVYALSSNDGGSNGPLAPSETKWYSPCYCGDGNTYKSCWYSGTGDKCSPWDKTDPDPKCPDTTE